MDLFGYKIWSLTQEEDALYMCNLGDVEGVPMLLLTLQPPSEENAGHESLRTRIYCIGVQDNGENIRI
jgi:hypothetical protein